MSSSHSTASLQAITAAFTQARRSGASIDQYPGVVPQTLAEAYACQDAAIARWDEQPAGWKVARIGPKDVVQFPEERLIGPAFTRNIRFVGAAQVAQCPVFAGGFAAVETEVVILVGADAPADKLSWTPDEARELIGEVRTGVEIASSPLATLNDLGTGAVISDLGNNWGVVVGSAAISDWRTRCAPIDCETFIDGVSVGKRSIEFETGPLAALAFALGKAASRGFPLRRGAVISTGMITGVHDIRIGQQSRHVFSEYGAVECNITRAQALAD